MFKYIYKGPDKAQAVIKNDIVGNEAVDEINEYIDARYISAVEGVWHIFSFIMHSQDPPVIRLETHLEDKNTIVFKDQETIVNKQPVVRVESIAPVFGIV